MSEQVLDLRTPLAILRRHRGLVIGAAAVGVCAGVAYTVLRPPPYTSTSLVLLPAPTVASSGQSTSHDAATQVRIAESDVVLAPAGKTLNPALNAEQLGKQVNVSSPTNDIVQIKASADSASAAQTMSQSVADSYISYVKEAANPTSAATLTELKTRADTLRAQVNALQDEITTTSNRIANESTSSANGIKDAQLLTQLKTEQANVSLQLDKVIGDQLAGSQPLTSDGGAGATLIQVSPGSRPSLFSRLLTAVPLAVFFFVGLMAALLLWLGRRDRRLRSRDEIADALGSGVIAALQSRTPKEVAGWSHLLQTYEPGTVDSWALRQGLRQLAKKSTERATGHLQHPESVTVVTFADDARGLSVGPIIASFASSLGTTTRLVGAQRQDSAAALWAACSGAPDDQLREGLLVDTHPDEVREADLTVFVVVVSREHPALQELPPSEALVLAVSSGTATAEDLAVVAVAADDAGLRFDGVLVADPDRLDRTSGRHSAPDRQVTPSRPTRLTGRALEGRATVSDFRRRLR